MDKQGTYSHEDFHNNRYSNAAHTNGTTQTI